MSATNDPQSVLTALRALRDTLAKSDASTDAFDEDDREAVAEVFDL